MADSPASGASLSSVSPDNLGYDDRGLVPAIVQDARSGEVLMLAWMNRESVARTLDTGESWFYSRSRQELWHKGATSGNRQRVRWMRVDCDADTLLVGVEQLGGGACHVEGQRNCFFRGLQGADASVPEGFEVLAELARVVAQRKASMPDGSYTTRLFRDGVARIAQKVGEEAVEVILAAQTHASSPGDDLAGEVADLLYHLMVLMTAVGLEPGDVFAKLRHRRGGG